MGCGSSSPAQTGTPSVRVTAYATPSIETVRSSLIDFLRSRNVDLSEEVLKNLEEEKIDNVKSVQGLNEDELKGLGFKLGERKNILKGNFCVCLIVLLQTNGSLLDCLLLLQLPRYF